MDRELHKKLEQRMRLTDAKDCGDIAVKKEKRDGKYPGKPAASGRDIGQPSNTQICNEVRNMYQSFVLEVDPKDVLDLLIQRRVISIERKDEVMSKVTKQDRCRALLDQLLLCSHDEAFLVLREALNKNYPWIVERIDKSINNEVISLAKRDLDPSKNNEVELNRQPDEANRRIRELEKEVVEYRTKNLRLESELRVLQESYDDAKDGERNVKDELQTRLEQQMRLTDVEEYVDSTVKIAVKKETPTGKCPGNHLDAAPPVPPRRSTSSTGLNKHSKEMAEVQTACLVLKEREIECSDIHLESLVESTPHTELVKAPPLPPRRSTSSTDLHSKETAELQTACLVLKEREIECSDLHFESLVVSSRHTELWKGRWKKSIDVSVKKLISTSLSETKFFVEAQLLDRLRHQNIVQLIGISSLAQPLQIVSEYLSDGNLLDHLKEDQGNTVNLPLIIDFARQIVDGMCFVASKGIVHGALRAFNVLLALPKLVKISNFECAVDLQKEYVISESIFPVRWTAPEPMHFSRWTPTSDVWSFGILLYEMFTFGKVPYSGRTNLDVIQLIITDYRLPCPQSSGKALGCPDTIYLMMVRCWDKDSDARPSFQMLQYFFQDIFKFSEAPPLFPKRSTSSTDLNKHSRETDNVLEIKCSDLLLESLVESNPQTEIWKGRWQNSTDVSVKELISSKRSATEFFVEAQVLDRVKHWNVVKLIGISSLAEPLQIVTEYLFHGSLRDYLQKCQGNAVNIHLLVKYASNIADGMTFVASQGIVHRDLRACNLLRASPNWVKISNFELALDLRNQTKAQEKTKESPFQFPWTAPESLEFGLWTPSSDVWSFGILLYEMFTSGEIPYSDKTESEVLELIKADYRLPCPQSIENASGCPDTLYQTMAGCWDKESDVRPSFQMLKNFFREFVVSKMIPLRLKTSTSSTDLNKHCKEKGDIVQDKILARPMLVTTIKGCAAVRGMALLDGWLYVVRFGSTQVEVYEARDKFKRSKKTITVAPSGKREKLGLFHRLKSRTKKEHISSGIQDIASCNRNKRLYLSDWQDTCVHCIDPVRKEVTRSWSVESGEPWGISVTSDGNIVVSLGDSGQLCEYSAEGLLMRTIKLQMVGDDGPWHAFHLLGVDSWVVCHGDRYFDEGYVSVVDSEGNYVIGFEDIELDGSSHLALLSSNHVLVAETRRNRILLLNPSQSVPIREILNLDHGIVLPVRIHLCESSGRLVVGIVDGTVLVYQIMSAAEEPSADASRIQIDS